MCMGLPGRIVELSDEHPHLARVEVMGGAVRQINIGLLELEDPGPGDWVDVHSGMAVALLDEEEARRTIAFLESLADERLDAL